MKKNTSYTPHSQTCIQHTHSDTHIQMHMYTYAYTRTHRYDEGQLVHKGSKRNKRKSGKSIHLCSLELKTRFTIKVIKQRFHTKRLESFHYSLSLTFSQMSVTTIEVDFTTTPDGCFSKFINNLYMTASHIHVQSSPTQCVSSFW